MTGARIAGSRRCVRWRPGRRGHPWVTLADVAPRPHPLPRRDNLVPKLTKAPFHWRSTALAVQMARRGKIDKAVSVAVSFIGVRG
jgi:hypothetical protein